MLKTIEYDRVAAVNYAQKWAFLRNPKYMDFDPYGGDCTNFISQCLYAGSKVMNYTPLYGWYFENSNNRTPSWTGVEFLYRFLVNNKNVGPFSKKVEIEKVKIGDVIQLGKSSGEFYHSLLVVETGNPPELNNTYTSSHTLDSFHRKLNSYKISQYRCIHIEGVRKFEK